MATTDSPLNIKGSIKGLRFYRRVGCPNTIVGEKGGANRNLIRNHWKFAGLRKAENEFKGRCKCARDIRLARGQWSAPVVDRFIQAKLTGVLQQVMNMDDILKKGKRAINLSSFKEVLNLINYPYYKQLGEVLLCPYSVETSEDKKTVKVTLKGLNPKLHIKAPAMASHFQLWLCIGTVTDYKVYPRSKKYMRTVYVNANQTVEVSYPWVALNGELMDEVSLSATLSENHILGDTHSILRSFGIIFGKMMLTIEPIAKDRGSIAFLGAV